MAHSNSYVSFIFYFHIIDKTYSGEDSEAIMVHGSDFFECVEKFREHCADLARPIRMHHVTNSD